MATSPPLDLKNIQGDILGGMPKKTQTNLFFQITNVLVFRKQLSRLIPLITTAEEAQKQRDEIQKHKDHQHPGLVKLSGVNIAFSHFGFKVMNIDDSKLADNPPPKPDPTTPKDPFLAGQRFDSQFLNDKGTGTGDQFHPDWLPEFNKEIHGVIVFTGDRHDTVEEKIKQVLALFGVPGLGPSITIVTKISGDVRPGKEAGHEHICVQTGGYTCFGFKDGVSNPAVIGFDKKPPPGPDPVRPGIILVGREGDSVASRDPWQVDGSFLAFRYLFQLVPEFNSFLKANPVKMPGLSPEEGSELLGARLVGRWKSGAPVDLRPFEDDPVLAANAQKNNNFSFAAEINTQKICPFAAHVRKTNPRKDIGAAFLETRRILRRGIQFGPEVTGEEKKQNKTIEKRGLIFHSYQSSLSNGFRFLQKSWANNVNFPPGTPQVPGFDSIIGQAPQAGVRALSGTDPDDPTISLTLPVQWVISRGGEYFFSPSIKGLKEKIATH